MKLRDYQVECVDTILSSFDKMDAQIVQLPTGAGKTVILWHVLKALQKKALIVAPTRELTEQIEETGHNVVYHGDVYLKKRSYWPNEKPYLIMTCQAATFALKGDGLKDYGAEILVVDEAHRSRSKGLETLIASHLETGGKVLGLTATPERMDGRSLLDIYTDLTYSCTLIDLIQKGYLVDLECYKVKTRQKIEEMKYAAGDLAPSVLRQLDVDARNEIILDVYLNRCPGKKALVFCLNVAHAEKMADQFVKHGVRAMAIHGGMNRTTRQAIIRCYKEGSVQVLCNCQLLTEGFDEPSIEALILARPTKSKTLYCQMVGRGVRPFEGKNKCLVYDLTDEIHNICDFNVLGGIPPESTFEWQDGEQLTKAVDRHKLTIDEVTYDVEAFRMYKEIEYDGRPAHDYQKEILWMYNAPFLDEITIRQAAYLLLKSRLLEEHGIDPRTYWKEWRENIPLCGEVERDEARTRLIQRSLDGLHMEQVSGDGAR